MILAINIYALVCSLVMNPAFAFFQEEGMEFLNFIMKLLIIGGGALTMQKSMALIGNLVSQGAGSNELRDNALSMGGLARMAKGAAGKALGVASLPLKPFGSILGNAYGMQTRHLGMRMLRGMGLDGGYPKKNDKDDKSDKGSNGSGSKNNDKANYGSDPNSTKNAINGNGFKRAFGNNNNTNNNQANKKNDAVGNAIQNGGNNQQQNNQNTQQQPGGENK